MLELVFALKNDWTEILELADSLLVFLLQSLQEDDKYAKLTAAAQRLYPAAGSFKLGLDKNGKLPRVRFNEAKAILRDHLGKTAHVEEDLSYVLITILLKLNIIINEWFRREEEASLGELFASNKSPLGSPTNVFIITHFPTHLRPCNVSSLGQNDATTNSFDIILRGQEIVTGCQLLHSYKEVRAAFTNRAHPIDPDCLGWRPYTEAHEIGMPPWGGFGRKLSFTTSFHCMICSTDATYSWTESSCSGIFGFGRCSRDCSFPA